MAELKPYPVRKSVRQHIVVELNDTEYVPSLGDRRPSGERREARIIEYRLEYRWVFAGTSGRWDGDPGTSQVVIQQRIGTDEWGAPRARKGADIPAEVFDTYKPTTVMQLTGE